MLSFADVIHPHAYEDLYTKERSVLSILSLKEGRSEGLFR